MINHVPKYMRARIRAEVKQKIPRVIFQTHETNVLPQRMLDSCSSWLEKNPEYDYIFFDKNDRLKFITKYFDKKILNIYNALSHGAIKADLFRFCYLYKYGGIYSDIDQVCLKPLSSVIDPEDHLVTGLCKKKTSPHQSLLISAPKNPIFLHLIESGCQRFLDKTPIEGPWAGRTAGFFGPPALGYSWIYFHDDKAPEIDIEAYWLHNYKYQKGKYVKQDMNFNVKKFGLVDTTIDKNTIATVKYEGYLEDNKELGITPWYWGS